MVTFDAMDRASELPFRHDAISDLWSRRDFYLKAWHDLDQALLNRSQSFPRLVAFGGGANRRPAPCLCAPNLDFESN